ncbi:MafB family polymorphic toxin [Neisseria dentiae]|uniref:MafB family polymorphic toxin n=1 Tax=Neisseria dentiae TaxID=194197 RepID=UPI0035A1AB81
MKPLRKLTGFIAAAAFALAAFGQQAAAADLKNDPFVTQNADRKNFEPGGQYHLFGTPRGSVADRTGRIDVTQAYKHQMGNLLIQQANIKGDIGYKTLFSGHGHEVHAPFDEHASRSASDEKGSVAEGFTVYRLNWSGHKHHPADGYDGPQGGGYPAPTGARDEYSYSVNGIARSIKFNPTDTRSISQRFRDNYSNLGSNFSDRANEANKKMFDHNPNLDRWGNAMEFINGVAAGAVNPFLSAGEAVGLGDALYGTGYAIDKATMYGIAPLSADGKLSAIGGLGKLGGVEKDIGNAVRDWSAENPNAAETVEAAFNAAAVAKAAKLAKTGTGKAAVSEDFSDSVKVAKPSIKRFDLWDADELKNSAKEIDRGGLTIAGRALQKHGNREGSAFPRAQGNPTSVNLQAEKVVNDILNNPNTISTQRNTGRFGKVTDIVAPDGRGLRYDSNGKLIGFLEPKK